MSTSTDQLHLGIDPVRNYQFRTTVDNSYAIGIMHITGLQSGSAVLSMARGITNTIEDRVFHNWLTDEPNLIIIDVADGRVFYKLTNITVGTLKFSDLDAGANALLMQQVTLVADVEVIYDAIYGVDH